MRLLLPLLRLKWWWWWRRDAHFTPHDLNMVLLSLGTPDVGMLPYYRAFLSAQMIRSGDRVLDIGCGDGFLAARFFAPNASQVDAVDIEEEAITYARRRNARKNVRFARMDATREPFPGTGYDVVVWDGAIGHFAKETNEKMLAKIAGALSGDGVFCGSESLGDEGADHLQRWTDLSQVREMLAPHFKVVRLWQARYSIGSYVRDEFYWRCAANADRLETWR